MARPLRNDRKYAAQAPPAPRRGDPLRRLYLLSSAVVAGAAVMVVELSGNRLLAPWFGNTLYTWTGLIGVLLLSLSGGYYAGGLLTDKRPHYALLAHLFLAAGLLVALIPWLEQGVLAWLGTASPLWGPVAATLLLFALPGFLLAMVSPFAIRLVSLLSADRRVGLSAGAIGMASTLGSVGGTFATGFVLVPHIGVRSIFGLVAALLLALALVGYLLFLARPALPVAAGCLLAAALGIATLADAESENPAVIHDQTTFYHRIRVVEQRTPTGDRLRDLWLDTTSEGGQYVESRQLPHDYQHYWRLATLFRPDLRRAVFLGGGGYAMPEALLDAAPQSRVDVVEIDPAVVAVGRKYFRVGEYPRLHAVADDARLYLRRQQERYDVVFGDAYSGVRCIPAHLVTREFFQVVSDRLASDGVFIMNCPGTVEGADSTVFRALLKTLSSVFPATEVFLTYPDEPGRWQNIFLAASRADLLPAIDRARRAANPVDAWLLAGRVERSRYWPPDGQLLTDDYNPIEYLVARTIR